MRRKSERTATKKAKPSPEKKVEKVKRTRRGRRKQSSSSDNESADDGSPARVIETTAEVEVKPPQTPVKEDSLEEAQDQVWRVKAAGGSGDGGEIQKIKICLTRPPSTPERVDRSPRSKRKHSRATSSSDTPSNEGVDDKKKTKHRSRKTTRESKDDKGVDSHGEDVETEPDIPQDDEKSNNEVTQSDSTSEKDSKEAQPPAETPMSTTNEEVKENESENVTVSTEEDSQKEECKEPDSQKKECKEPDSQKKECKDTDSQKNECKEPDSQKNESKEPDTQNNECQEPDSQKPSDADTTVVSPKDETTVASPTIETPIATAVAERKSPERKRSLSVDKSEILEIHADESKCESSDNEAAKPKEDTKDEPTAPEETSSEKKVSKIEDIVSKESEIVSNESNKTDVVESSKNNDTEAPKTSTEDEVMEKENIPNENEIVIDKPKQLECSDSTVSKQDVSVPNGQATPAPTRKRRWGSRPTKLTTQKSITISTDVLKDIIPDVKPVEFEEVIEEKKHKKIEKYDKVERPILPKIVIDNTENVERHKYEGKERDRDVKPRETHLAVNRKISIVKDNDSIIARPPSPPRNKQSCILYITNLVRPFTLPQLKNLLQRTGKIEENGFWIDRIKSKCFVKYETDDQAVETRHALHGVTWPVSNPKTLQVDFSTQEAFDKAKLNEETDGAPVSTIPGTVEDWLREQDQKRERGELEKPWERKASTREWDLGKNEKDKDKDKVRRDERPMDKRRHRSPEKSPEPAKKFKKKEEEAPAKLLDDLFRKTKTTPCIYWLPLSAETIAVKEEQRRQHMAEHERRLQELRRTHRRH